MTTSPDSAAVGTWGWLQVDCADPLRLAEFWSRVLGVTVRGRLDGPDGSAHYVFLNGVAESAPRLSFQRVGEVTGGKNRLHIDLAVPDVAAATARMRDLGATEVAGGDVHEHDMHWRVLADPEGNVFCLVEVPDS